VKPVRVIRAVALGVMCGTLFFRNIFIGFEPARLKLVETPIQARAGTVEVGPFSAATIGESTSPLAVIGRIHFRALDTGRFVVNLDGQAICDAQLVGGASSRVDCSALTALNERSTHQFAITGPETTWTLDYLETATHYGSSRGFNSLYVLPVASTRYARPLLRWSIGITLVVTLVLLVPLPNSRGVRIYSAVVVPIVLAFWIVLLVAPLVSQYLIIISVTTFLRWLVLLLAPWLYGGLQRALQPTASSSRLMDVGRAIAVAVIVTACYGSVVHARLRDYYAGNYSGLLLISERLFDGNPLINGRSDVRNSLVLTNDSGYDAQFMYFAVFDPLLRAYRHQPSNYQQVMDVPPYRFGRIGFSWLTWLFSAGDWRLYPRVMIGILLSSIFAATAILALMAQHGGLSAAVGALFLVLPGPWSSLQSGLPEPVATALVLAGCLVLFNGQWVVAALIFGLSLLVRETGAVIVVCYVIALALTGAYRKSFLFGLLALSPLVAWRLYVGWIFASGWGLRAFVYEWPTGLPLAGILNVWNAVKTRSYPPDLSFAALVFPVVLIAGLALAATLFKEKPSATTAAATIYGLMAISLSLEAVWIHVGNAERTTFELFVMLAVATTAVRSYSPQIRRLVVMFWLIVGAYTFFGTWDAQYVRDAVLLIS